MILRTFFLSRVSFSWYGHNTKNFDMPRLVVVVVADF
jgi:hypothetical protein